MQSEIGKPKWEGSAEGKSKKTEVRIKRKEFDEAWDSAHEEKSEAFRRELRSLLRRIDREHSLALWAEVRSKLDYPVFTAAPEEVGITSTGAEGPNDLPRVLEAWKVFREWLDAGAAEGKMPIFAE
jgi:type I restriction enzyme M protein